MLKLIHSFTFTYPFIYNTHDIKTFPLFIQCVPVCIRSSLAWNLSLKFIEVRIFCYLMPVIEKNMISWFYAYVEHIEIKTKTVNIIHFPYLDQSICLIHVMKEQLGGILFISFVIVSVRNCVRWGYYLLFWMNCVADLLRLRRS
jgi:uncharacterized protein (DUF486 family)